MYSADSHMQCVGKEQSIPTVNISGASLWVCESASPRVRKSASPQSAKYIRSTDSVERPTIHSVPSSSVQVLLLSGGVAHHKFCACFSPPILYGCVHLWSAQSSCHNENWLPIGEGWGIVSMLKSLQKQSENIYIHLRIDFFLTAISSLLASTWSNV